MSAPPANDDLQTLNAGVMMQFCTSPPWDPWQVSPTTVYCLYSCTYVLYFFAYMFASGTLVDIHMKTNVHMYT